MTNPNESPKKSIHSAASDGALRALDRLVGSWNTEATHPALPGVVVQGTAAIEWLEGGRFLVLRTHNDHADFPDAISIVGFTERDRIDGEPSSDRAGAAKPGLRMHYFDSRGVFRDYEVGIDARAWRIWRDATQFSQRFTGTFADDGNTIVGLWQLCRADNQWDDDLQITYRRRE